MRRSAILPFVLTLVVAGAPAAGFTASPAVGEKLDPAAALVREEATLRAELELARGGGFYVRLDARRRQLSLVLEGILLEDYSLEALATASPRVLFWRRPQPAGWELRSWDGGGLDPQRERRREEVVAPAPSPNGDAAAVEPSPPPVPPTAEETFSVPARYRIVFAGGLTLEVTAEDGGRNRGLLLRARDALVLRAADLLDAMRASGAGRVRIRVRMSAEDAASLYRSLPPDVGLVVVGLVPR